MRKPTIAVVILLAILFVGFLAIGPGHRRKARSFAKQVQQTAAATQIQDWALGQIELAEGGRMELDSLPSFLDMPNDGLPNYAHVEPNSGQPYLVAQWGGGFGHWGLLVGSQSLKYPIEDHFHIEWAPGVYIWHEIQ